ncbi:MAG: radical SAM protein [Planctomycetota bacterium]|nr:radical SAM protein [Bacteroidota bacterium]MBU1721052.1 radical SAM protein [Bacteroidota bacterium]
MENAIIAPSFLPDSAILEMGYACNHQCMFCSCPWEHEEGPYSRGAELTTDQWKQCIEKLVGMGVCHFSYTGGEPLLHPGITEIMAYTATLKARHYNRRLEYEDRSPGQYLITNGQFLTDEILQLLHAQNISLSLSLPGLKTYSDHTQQSGNPDNILNWFQKASALGLKTVVNITVTKNNLHELYETVSNAFIAGAETLLLNRFLPGGRGMRYAEELLLNKEETIEMLLIADEVLQKANRTGSTGTELPICLTKDLELKILRVGTRCAAAVEFFVIGPEGRVRTCNHSPVQLEHYTEIEQLKTNPYWKKFVLKDYLPEMCQGCNLSNICDGGCREAAHVYTGDVTGKDAVFLTD